MDKSKMKLNGSNYRTIQKGNRLYLVSYSTMIAWLNMDTGKIHRLWAKSTPTSMNHVRKAFGLESMTRKQWFSLRLEKI